MVHSLTEAEQRVRESRPRFFAALESLGAGDAERARALDVQRFTVRKYRLGLATPRYLIDFEGGRARPSADPAVLRARAQLVRAYLEDVAAESEMVAA
jgi:hypothetical protein